MSLSSTKQAAVFVQTAPNKSTGSPLEVHWKSLDAQDQYTPSSGTSNLPSQLPLMWIF